MASPFELLDAAQRQSQITAAALIDRARQDFGALTDAEPIPSDLKDVFSRDGARQAIMEAYVTLSGEALAPLSDNELDAEIRKLVTLLVDGLRIFARQAPS